MKGAIIDLNNETYTFYVEEHKKYCRSKDYNFLFDKDTGYFARWGRTYADNPRYSPVGPEILDLEISINGCPNECKFCYKANSNRPATNMSFADFKNIVDKMPPTLTQIAFGITGVQTNPDFVRMLKYCREKGIVPNFTLSGIDLTDDLADEIAKHVGAVAVSAYQSNKEVCYDTVKKFVDRGVAQTNIHVMVSQETLPFVYEVLNDVQNSPKLSKLNAVVFLGVKPKGRARTGFKPLGIASFKELVAYSLNHNVHIGFDSCSAPKFDATVRELKMPEVWKSRMLGLSESCESALFSAYINVHGEMWYCSFSEHEPNVAPVNVLDANDFIKDVWYASQTVGFRNRVLASADKHGCRRCVTFPEINI